MSSKDEPAPNALSASEGESSESEGGAEGESTDALELNTPARIKAEMLKTEMEEDWLRKRLMDVRDEINNETLHIEHARQQKVKEAKLVAQHKSDLHKVKLMAVLKEKKRRIEVNRCLGMIRGGKDEVYFKLQALFAKTPTEFLCPVLKAFEFPHLAKAGYNEGIYKKYALGKPVAEDGTEILFFKAAKHKIFRCMCNEQASVRPDFQHPKIPEETEFEDAAKEASHEVKEDMAQEKKAEKKANADAMKQL